MNCYQLKRCAIVITLIGVLATFAVTAQATVIHDWEFLAASGAADVVGGAAYNATLHGDAELVLGGGVALNGTGYLTLPNNIIPTNATSVTLSTVFITWGSPDNSALFSLGSSWAPSGQTIGHNFVSGLARGRYPADDGQAIGLVARNWGEATAAEQRNYTGNYSTDGNYHSLQVVLDQVGNNIQQTVWYDGGCLQGPTTLAGASLSAIAHDTTAGTTMNNFLGRSVFAADPTFTGAILNFQIDATVPAPEPGTLVLLTTGLFGLVAYAWRKRK
jgi:hypothetical protein